MNQKKPGRPRDEKGQQNILSAAYELLLEKGFGAVTVEAVAKRAGVGKSTIYRYWPNAQQLVFASVLERPSISANTNNSGSLVEDLREHLLGVIETFSTKEGRQIVQMMAASEQDSEIAKAFRNQVILRCREQGRSLFERSHSQTASTISTETLLDMIYGPIFYRLLTRHAAVDEKLVNEICNAVSRLVHELNDKK